MKVLLVQPYYKTKYVPLGLLKISTYHKNKGDEVRFQSGEGWFIDFQPDIIYITTLFTWDYDRVVETINSYRKKYPKSELRVGGVLATLLPAKIEQDTGIRPFIGIWDEVENMKPDWSLFQNIDYSCGFTSRGCPNKCSWCMVSRHEPNYIEIPTWYENLDLTKKRIILWDNNFLASSKGHFDNVIDKLKEIGKQIDFNQGLDVRLLTDYKAKRLSEIKLSPVRFSFDHPSQEKALVNGIGLMKKYRKINENNCTIYLLYNFEETPQEALRRANVIRGLGCSVFAMRYKPLNWTSSKVYLSNQWTEKEAKKFSYYFNRLICQKIFSYEKFQYLKRDKSLSKNKLKVKKKTNHSILEYKDLNIR